MRKVIVGAFVLFLAAGTGVSVGHQAGPFWGLVVGVLVVFFGLLAFAPVFSR